MTKPRHVLGISGGKDSAALAIYLNSKYPVLDIDYYFCDTGKELDETYALIGRLETFLGKKVTKLVAEDAKDSHSDPFDYFYKIYRGYLPSSQARWCTKKLKLEPFENYVGTEPVISYVGIRGDENREGYISKKSNIQSIFPFRRNIWSEDVIDKILNTKTTNDLLELYSDVIKGVKLDRIQKCIAAQNANTNTKEQRLAELLNFGVAEFNNVVFKYLKGTKYPLALETEYPLIDNDEILIREDIFRLLRESGVGVPEYYEKIAYESNGQVGEYARSRSGCYFCFFQQKIEWIWLYEQHPDLFKKAMKYENEDKGFTWNQNETLEDIIHPIRMGQIKREHTIRKDRAKCAKSPYLVDILDDTESEGCTACFI